MKIFPRLYKRAASGSIRTWQVEVTKLLENHYEIARTSGQLNGQPVIAYDTVTSGVNIGKANETTPEYQAQFNAQSYWNKQKDNGYKTLEELKINGDDGNPILYRILDQVLPKFNTDATGNVKPMLAKKYVEGKIVYPMFAQPKLDGIRCLMTVESGNVTYRTRSGKIITTLDHITDSLDLNPYDNFILDGEVYSDDLSFQDISSAFKALSDDSQMLKLRVFDIVSDSDQTKRIDELTSIVLHLNSDYIQPVETTIVNSDIQVLSLHDRWVDQGNEGAILRHPRGLYKQGARSPHLLKVKMFEEEEFELIGWELGKRGIQDLNAVVLLPNGKQSKPTMMGTIAQKCDMYNSIKFNSRKLLTVKHFGRTEDGLLRHPNGKIIRDYD